MDIGTPPIIIPGTGLGSTILAGIMDIGAHGIIPGIIHGPLLDGGRGHTIGTFHTGNLIMTFPFFFFILLVKKKSHSLMQKLQIF